MVVFTFFVFDMQVLSKKFIWYFDVAWLISLQFTRRVVKPVAFLIQFHLLNTTSVIAYFQNLYKKYVESWKSQKMSFGEWRILQKLTQIFSTNISLFIVSV